MKAKDNPICPECTGWMEEKDGWLKCRSCKFQKKSSKIKITPLPKRRSREKENSK